jgi:hypothetical protein
LTPWVGKQRLELRLNRGCTRAPWRFSQFIVALHLLTLCKENGVLPGIYGATSVVSKCAFTLMEQVARPGNHLALQAAKGV